MVVVMVVRADGRICTNPDFDRMLLILRSTTLTTHDSGSSLQS